MTGHLRRHCRRLLLDAGIGGGPGAFVKAGEDRVGDFLAFDQVDHRAGSQSLYGDSIIVG